MGSGVEWPKLATVEKECCQLYERYKGEEWVRPFDVHFTPVDPSLEFLMDDLTVGMMVSAPAVASTSNTTKHLVGALAVARGEGWSKGCGDDEALVASLEGWRQPQGAKGRGRERHETRRTKILRIKLKKRLAALLCWQKTSTVVDTGLEAGMKLEKAKGKVTVSLEKRQEYKRTQGACDNC
ncbi:hypothetical protein E4T56_gene11500 [Termitomyces sp. T112]|nr:hypothetical protein E4T56_gene11500 [Termitomyces sp. T112]